MITTPELREKRFGVDSAEAAGEALAKKLGAADVAALRAMDAETLINEAPKTGYLPWGTIDGRILPRQLVDTFDRGEQERVPVLAGFDRSAIRALGLLLSQKPDSGAEMGGKFGRASCREGWGRYG